MEIAFPSLGRTIAKRQRPTRSRHARCRDVGNEPGLKSDDFPLAARAVQQDPRMAAGDLSRGTSLSS
jgi:hypothetical protein